MLVALPLMTVADVAPVSREEWARLRQFRRLVSVDVPSTTVDVPTASLAEYVLASLIGVLLSVFVIAMVKCCAYRGKSWRDFASMSRMKMVIFTMFMLAGCLCAELAFRPVSTFLSRIRTATPHNETHEETYEEYLFYDSHCRTCGTALKYNRGRYCPKCHPERDPENCWATSPK